MQTRGRVVRKVKGVGGWVQLQVFLAFQKQLHVIVQNGNKKINFRSVWLQECSLQKLNEKHEIGFSLEHFPRAPCTDHLAICLHLRRNFLFSGLAVLKTSLLHSSSHVNLETPSPRIHKTRGAVLTILEMVYFPNSRPIQTQSDEFPTNPNFLTKKTRHPNKH